MRIENLALVLRVQMSSQASATPPSIFSGRRHLMARAWDIWPFPHPQGPNIEDWSSSQGLRFYARPHEGPGAYSFAPRPGGYPVGTGLASIVVVGNLFCGKRGSVPGLQIRISVNLNFELLNFKIWTCELANFFELSNFTVPFASNFQKMMHFGKIPKKFGQYLAEI